VVASVDGVAVTQSDVEKEYRFELFLQGSVSSAAPDTPTIELVRDRLIDQMLLLRESDAENFPAGDDSSPATEGLAEVRKKFESEQAFESALQSLGMDRPQVIERLHERSRILKVIDERLRPSAHVERADVEAYYQKTFIPEFARRAQGPPPALGDVEGQITEILTQKKIDELLNKWLQSLKSSHRVNVYPF
jgi:peptidyl-prolyl cis-trans isomerase SurA